ncbi:helix-turn-helix DNA binding domain protein [Arthrobacter phage Shoya]|uniref:Helix-turn-helix DNA binding domain protein n=1 Tax=Arthrobacter phage Shoya TaxID=2704035 RepID=A0A6G6XI64_9CAUD|nr:helix-turn-helix DNA binding domain protein [Arthrobacter phage Shoya]QIG57704.1 helix-turn-helix DNA binding domain protein [Arthrobacter phage Shoya]
MIDLAGETFKYAGSLDTAAGERFGLSPTRYWQEVNMLLRTEAAGRVPASARLPAQQQAPARR